MDWLYDLISNPFILTAFSSWTIAQVLKVIINAVTYKKISLERLFGDGGMPSGHSATVSSMAIFSALTYGAGSFEFAITFILAAVVCHDAMGVRQETGKQAVVINEMLRTFSIMTEKTLPEIKLKELVGHSPLQVAAGIALGIANAFFMYFIVFA